jgi:hypothetical protein
MAQVAGKEGQFLPQVFALPDPNLQTMHGEGVSEIMHPRCRAIAVLLLNVRPCTEAYKVVSQRIASHWLAVRTDKNEIRVSSLCGA